MTRVEFLKKLEGLLQDIPLEERKQAIQYYEDYFSDAGEEKEQDVIRELKSPEKVAKMLKADLKDSVFENEEGEYTETGYVDPEEEKSRYQLSRNNELKKTENQNCNRQKEHYTYSANKPVRREFHRRQSNNFGKIILIVLLCIFGLPFVVPVVGTLFGLAVMAVCTFFGAFIAFACLAIAFVIGGIALIGIGIGQLFYFTAFSLFTIGVGLLLLGSGLLCGMFTIQASKKIIPGFCNWAISLIRRPFQNRRAQV